MVPMRDGVRLAISIYLPPGNGPWPVVLSRTPYGKDQGEPAKSEAAYMANGYVRVLQDSRGKFKSEGQYRPFANDIEDGYDTIEWIAKQPWSNGKVGMVGSSALGIATYNAAMSGAPHLVAAFVTVARGSNRPNGGVPMQHMEEWSRRQGVPAANIPRPIFRNYESGGPRDLLANVGKVNVPFYNVGGWYDIFLQGNIDGFSALQAHGGPKARGAQKLMLGAFGHGNVSGDLKYPADAGRIGAGDPIRWFDYWLKGVDNGIMKEPAVRYFVMGDTFDPSAPGNQWRTAESWPPRATATSYYLAAAGKLAAARPSGRDKASYVYDPKDPVRDGWRQQSGAAARTHGPAIGERPERRVEVRVGAAQAGHRDRRPAHRRTGRVHRRARHRFHGEADRRLSQRIRGVGPGRRVPPAIRQWIRQAVPDPTGDRIHDQDRPLVHGAGVQRRPQDRRARLEQQLPRFEKHSNTWDSLTSYDQSVKATNTVILDGRSRVVLPVTTIHPPRQRPAAAGNLMIKTIASAASSAAIVG